MSYEIVITQDGEAPEVIVATSTGPIGPEGPVGPPVNVVSYAIAGTGTPEADINLEDPPIQIAAGDMALFAHNNEVYLWSGPQPALVGVGGDHTVVAADLSIMSSADHTLLSNLAVADQHPTSAITELDAKLSISASHIADIVSNPHVVTYANIGGTQPAPVAHTHTEIQITNLDKYTVVEVNDLLDLKSDTTHTHTGDYAPAVHTHVEADVTDLDKYTQAEVDALLAASVGDVYIQAPTAPDVNGPEKLWYSTTKLQLYAKYDDGTSIQWMKANWSC